MYTRKQALALARQLRTCPPLSVKNDRKYEGQVRRHTEICPFCATALKDNLEALDVLSEKLKTTFAKAPAAQAAEPGQVRAVDPGLSCWRDDYFYTAPEVAVIETGPGNMVQVAQIWTDTALAGPGDLVLPDSMMKGFSELFIEPWNIYTLDKSFLGACTGTLDPAVIESVIKMADTPDYQPDWALNPMPMKENDPRIYFRELEIEVGYTFASMAVGTLVSGIQESGFPLELESLITRLKEKFSGISWDWKPRNIEECLAAVRLPSHVLPMAAADQDQKMLTAVYACVDYRDLLEIRPVQCRIDYTVPPPGPFSVSGIIEDLPDGIPADAFQCRIKDNQNRRLQPCDWSWHSEEKRFMAVFDRPLSGDETLVLFIVHHADSRCP